MNKSALLLGSLLIVAAASALATPSVVVNWTGEVTNGLGDASGTPLAVGDQLKLGYFNINDATIQANASNQSFLNSHFTLFDTTTIGDIGNPLAPKDTAGIAGYFAASSPAQSTVSLGLSGKQIYMWAFNAVSWASATQQGIFSATTSNWFFPDDSSTPSTTSIDLNQVTDIIVGGFGTGTAKDSNNISQPLFNTALIVTSPIPEPSSFALFGGLAALGALAVRRRRS